MYLIYSISLVHVGLALLLCPLSVHCKATDEESMHPPSEPTDFSTAVFEPVDEFHVSAPEALGHRLLRRDVSESRSNDGNRYQLKHSEGFVMAPGHTMERLDKRGFHFHLPVIGLDIVLIWYKTKYCFYLEMAH